MHRVTGGRLTRQELGWLLAQEAQGAAKALRAEVSELQRALPPGAPGPRPAEHRLNALDQAIVLLSGLPAEEAQRQRRKGRVDIAGLLYELVPDWSIAIAPGAGTEVYGDSQDFRRILQVLLSQTQGRPELLARGGRSAPEISVKREGEWVRISVQLGPDAATPTELDRTWLSRMTLRYGGRLELQGKTQSILLPAESSSQREIEALRRELAEAQLLGETYAKDLAAVFSEARPEPEPLVQDKSTAQKLADQTLNTLRALAASGLLSHGPAGDTDEPPEPEAARRRAAASALLAELQRLPPTRATARVALQEALSSACRQVQALAHANASALHTTITPGAEALALECSAPVLQLLLRALLEHALAATPRGEPIRVALRGEPGGFALSVEDGGPNVPEQQGAALLACSVDPRTLGRPTTPELLVVYALAAQLGIEITFGSSPNLRTQVVARGTL